MNRGGRQNKHFSLMKQIFTYFFFLAFGTVLTAQVCPINNNIRNGTPKVFFTFTSEAEANYYEDTQTSGSGVSDCGGADCDNLNNAVFSGMASPSGTAFNATFDKVRDHTGTEIKFNDDLPAGVTATDFFEGTVTFNFDGGITLTCSYNASGVLPVVFADFTARSHNGTVQLDWTTATELNNDYFQVERSADGREFTALGKVNGNGNSETFLNYTFTDREPLTGASYYRLRQVDYDGTEAFSHIVSVKNTTPGTLTAFPTILNGTRELTLDLPEAATLELLNVSGQRVRTFRALDAGTQRIDLNGLGAGMYILRTDNERSTKIFLN